MDKFYILVQLIIIQLKSVDIPKDFNHTARDLQFLQGE